jgi:hypothetical protein
MSDLEMSGMAMLQVRNQVTQKTVVLLVEPHGMMPTMLRYSMTHWIDSADKYLSAPKNESLTESDYHPIR